MYTGTGTMQGAKGTLLLQQSAWLYDKIKIFGLILYIYLARGTGHQIGIQ